MPEISLLAKDAQSLALFLRFLHEWANASQDQVGESLAEFMGGISYDVGMLRHELTLYRAMLGDSTCRDADFLRHPARSRDPSPSRASTISGQAG